MSATAPVLINGAWIESAGTETFRAFNPQTGEEIGKAYPVSPWSEIERAVEAAHRADQITRSWPAERFAEFLDGFHIVDTYALAFGRQAVLGDTDATVQAILEGSLEVASEASLVTGE